MGSQDGHVLLKLKLGDDWRALSLVNEDLSHQDLALMAQRLFPSKVKDVDEIVFRYLDEDGDWVTLADDNDLAIAKLNGNKLRIKLEVADPNGAMLTDITVKAIKEEIKSLQDRLAYVSAILDNAQTSMPAGKSSVSVSQAEESPSAPPPTKETAQYTSSGIDQLIGTNPQSFGQEASPMSKPPSMGQQASPSAPPSNMQTPPTQTPAAYNSPYGAPPMPAVGSGSNASMQSGPSYSSPYGAPPTQAARPGSGTGQHSGTQYNTSFSQQRPPAATTSFPPPPTSTSSSTYPPSQPPAASAPGPYGAPPTASAPPPSTYSQPPQTPMYGAPPTSTPPTAPAANPYGQGQTQGFAQGPSSMAPPQAGFYGAQAPPPASNTFGQYGAPPTQPGYPQPPRW